jgi:NTE family protein
LEGGGIRGIAYVGALEELERRHVLDSIQNISGTSVGAMAGCLIAVGYKAAEVKELLYSLRVQSFNDGYWFFLGGQWRMRHLYGWYNGDVLEHWIDKLVAAKTGKTGLTLLELHELTLNNSIYKDLYVTASNLSKQRLVIFDWKHFPDMELATAVRASMSIPLYYKAMRLDSNGRKSESKTADVFVDGGLTMNYPLTVFDNGSPNPQTLGLKLERPEQIDYYSKDKAIAPYHISNFRSYVGALYNLTIETLARKGSMEDEAFRTIYISTAGVNPKVKRVSKKQKDLLCQSGLEAAQRFFKLH